MACAPTQPRRADRPIGSATAMARRSLRPQLNQIRSLGPRGSHRRVDRPQARGHRPADPGVQAGQRPGPRRAPPAARPAQDFDDEIDLRAEDDALIAAELEAAEAARAEEEARRAEEEARRAAEGDEGGEEGEDEEEPPAPPRAPRRARPPPRAAGRRWRARSTTARRATGCGSIPPWPTTPPTPSTGPATGPSRSRSRRTRS